MKLLSRFLFALAPLLFLIPHSVTAQPLTSHQIDSIAEKSMKTFDVPGIAVAVVKDGKIIHSKGYGLRSLRNKEKVDEHTLFGIASNSKAFTTAALGILVDEGKLKWTTKVTDIIPDFKLYAPYVTENFMVEDLITHRSGLGLGAGDLMLWPGRVDFSKKDIIHNLRYLKSVSQFRTKFDYDNLLYIVAGEVVARVSGTSWEDFVQKHIMDPLGMTESAPSFHLLKDTSDVIDPHAPVDGKLEVISRYFSTAGDAAGGIYSSVHDMAKWVIMQLNEGKYGTGLTKRLLSQKTHDRIWAMHTIISPSDRYGYHTHFSGYGYGWFLNDEMGYKTVSHTGGLAGIVTQVMLVPDLHLGIMVFTNQQSGAAFQSITNSIKDGYYGIKGHDRIKELHDRVVESQNYSAKVTGEITKSIDASSEKQLTPAELEKYAGTYQDPWFGDITLSVKDGKLWFTAAKSPDLQGPVYWYKSNTFVVKWVDRSLDADAFLLFGLDFQGKPSTIKMEAISPLTDFSFDFQDLDFNRVK